VIGTCVSGSCVRTWDSVAFPRRRMREQEQEQGLELVYMTSALARYKITNTIHQRGSLRPHSFYEAAPHLCVPLPWRSSDRRAIRPGKRGRDPTGFNSRLRYCSCLRIRCFAHTLLLPPEHNSRELDICTSSSSQGECFTSAMPLGSH